MYFSKVRCVLQIFIILLKCGSTTRVSLAPESHLIRISDVVGVWITVPISC